jgi:hypothetical protein
MERQTIKGAFHFVLNEPGKDGVVDIVPRIRNGIRLAASEGFDYCFIIENDDYYPDNYLEKMICYFRNDIGLLGIQETIYYSLQLKRWVYFCHPGRASLFCTALRISALKDYAWPDDELLYFDLHLWKYRCRKTLVNLSHPPIGMKHGNGFCPGNYHNGIVNGKAAKNMKEDPKMLWLKKRVRPESFEFYLNYNKNFN